MSTYVIAEIGSCHDGDLVNAMRLVDAAKAAGADAVKAQFWSDADKLADRRKVPKQYRELYQRYQVPQEWLTDIWRSCYEQQIDFMCTAYLPEDVAVVAPHVKHFKIASFEAEATDLLDAHLPFIDRDIVDRRPRLVYVSMGMGASVDTVVRHLAHGSRAQRVRFLLCTSSYPAPVETLNLRRFWPCRDWTEMDGLSDHSPPHHTWTGALAVAAGAEAIEAHLRLDATNPRNPDAPHAMTPPQFADYVRNIRFAEVCLSDGRETAFAAEAAMAAYRVTTPETP
jgi:N,N'-diacetyllegionaminate synthase